MDDVDIVRRIGELADEEHGLERSHEGEALSEAEVARLRSIAVALDQSWDPLRRRRARRAAGGFVVARRRGVRLEPAAAPRPVQATGRVSRTAELARLGARVGGTAAANRARHVFASSARKEELDRELELRTAEDVAATLGNM